MAETSTGARWLILASGGVVVALGVLLVLDSGHDTPEADNLAETVHSQESSPPPRDSSATADALAPQLAASVDNEPAPMDETSQQEGQATASEPTATDEPTGPPPSEQAEQAEQAASPGDSSAAPEDSTTASEPPVVPAAPAQRIADGGRLTIDAASLRDGDVLALGLGLSDEARGEKPLAVRIVSADGRRVETTATPAPGSGSGLRLEIDPGWLTPGRYMIEVSTAEETHFPLRRYVLEVP